MTSRLLAGLLVAGCVTAAGAGAYVAMRQNAAVPPRPTVAAPATPALAPQARPVSETEAVVSGTSPATAEKPASAPGAADPVRPAEKAKETVAVRPEATRDRGVKRPVEPPASQRAAAAPSPVPPALPAERATAESPAPTPAPETAPEAPRAPEPPPAPQFDEVVLPASSVVGLQVDTPLSSERSRVEDRVDAHVSRDVTVAGRLAIPSGSRVLGSVTLVERGGKMKDRARLGVRFHTLVLADGREVPLRTEAIVREGESPSNESARKIGGAAVGGAILGAILGGGKGAVVGGAAGAAGGSAAVMAGDRNAATLPAGTIVTVRLIAPATIEVERE